MRWLLAIAIVTASLAVPGRAVALEFSQVAQVVGEICIDRAGRPDEMHSWALERGWRPSSPEERSALTSLDTMAFQVGSAAWTRTEGSSSISFTVNNAGGCQVHYDGIGPQPFRELYELRVGGQALGEEDDGVPVHFSRVIAVRWLPETHWGWRVTNFMDLRTNQRGVVVVAGPR